MSSAPHTADLLLYGGHVLTFDPNRPEAQAVAIAAGRILAVGTEEELRSFVSPKTQTLACAGRTVLPGFIDPHLHLFAWASRYCGADLSAARSIAEIRSQLQARLTTLGSQDWLRGYGYDEFFLDEKRHPNRHDLDAIATDRPVILRHRTGHAAVLNSVALRRAGIHANFTPPSGGHVERDASGEPTGLVYELESFLRTTIPPLPSQEFQAGLRRVNSELLRHGICSFHDASAGNTLEDIARFSTLRANGTVRPHATVMVGIDAFPEVLEAELQPFGPYDRIRLGSIKIMLHESGGELYPPLDDLAEMVWQVHHHGFQVAIHAVEEAPVCAALDAIRQAQERLPRRDHRHRIEHCTLCPPPLLDTLAETGCAVVMQPGFLHFYGDKYAAEIDPDLHAWLYRAKSFRDRNIPIVGSSDCPIAPQAPLVAVQAAITRQSQTGIVLNPAERLSLPEAIGLFTHAGAWIGFEENRVGRIAPGMRADVNILDSDSDSDLTRLPAEAISSASVHTTIIDGQIVYSA